MKCLLSALAVGCVAASAMAASSAQQPQMSEAEKSIESQMGQLRSMKDTDRATTTKSLALQIRKLPAGQMKRLIAFGLANLTTEGDFGRTTLQEVTTTLELAVQETPPAATNGEPAPEYFELAQLAKYEHARVTLTGADYVAAIAKLTKIDQERGKASFTLNDITGKSWSLSQLKGKVVLVNFWATWCPPCRKEMPDMETLYKRFKDKGLVILAISDETIDKVRPFIEKNKYSYTVLLDPGRKVNEAYHVDGIPKSFIYDHSGKLVAQSIDMRTMNQFLGLLSQAGLK